MSRTRIRRKDIKQPDEFITVTTRSLEFVQTHPREFGWGAVAVLLFLGLFTAVTLYRRSQEASAQMLLGEATDLYHQAVDEGLGAPPTPAVTATLEKADAIFQAIGDRFPSTHAAAFSSLYRGYLRQFLGKPAEAVSFFEEARSRSNQEPVPTLADYGIAKSYDLEGSPTQAVQYYMSVVESEGNPLEEQATQDAIRCLMTAGQRAQAQSLLSEAQARFPNVPWVDTLRKRYRL